MNAKPWQEQPTIDQRTAPSFGGAKTVGISSATTSVPTSLRDHDDYDLLAEIGRGGMGVVFKAQQKSLSRVVAIKMVLSGNFAGEQERMRFRLEAQAIAQLQHPNIVQIYEVNEDEGRPFLALEFVDGGSLADRIRGQPLSSRAAAEMIRTLALAIHRAHQIGIVHRDLKPGNILLTADGVPKITDFGLAKRLPGASGEQAPENRNTASGQILGTPSYMAPEQADSRWRDIGPHTDVYALGAILYELLTGRPPFVAESALDTILHVLSDQPAPPRLLNSKVEEDLQTICLKCLEKDGRQRYLSAQELADDLDRFLRGDDIHARSVNLISRLTRVLEDRDHTAEFRHWANVVLWLAGIVFVHHTLTWLAIREEWPSWLDWTNRGVSFVIGVGTVLYYRRHSLWPTTAGERQLWAIWIGYFLAYVSNLAATRLLVFEGVIAKGEFAEERWRNLLAYPGTAVLGGLAMFIMGSRYWSRYYLVGIGFFVLAILMTFDLEWAPLELGTAWSLLLLLIGWNLRRMSNESVSQARP